MLLWNDLHPYHAIHIARVRSPLDLPRLSEVIHRTLQKQGLGSITLDARGGVFHYNGGAAKCDIKVIEVGEDPHAALAAEAAWQLNTRFAHDQSFSPFRFFVAAEHGSFYLGLAYFHAVADGESMVNLLKSIVACYLGNEDPADLELYPRSRDAIFFRTPRLFIKKVLAIAGQLRALRRARRRTCQDPLEMLNNVTFFSLKAEELQALVQTGKAWNVTLNDLFLALLLHSFSRLLPERLAPARRSKLAVGCIVNLRKELGIDSRRNFGLFLGSFVVTCEPGPGAGLRELAQAVQQQTSRIKQKRLYVATALELHFARTLLRFYSWERRKKFYQKNYPLWGGITNMNLDSIWQQPPGGPLVDYLRTVSTGPATPLVLSITTIGGAVNIGLSYRTACYSAAEVEQVKSCLLDEVRRMRNPA